MTIVRDRKIRPITVEAFRFVHLKNPNLYSGKDFAYDFVDHPDPTRSARLNGTENPSTEGMFTALSQVRAINADLYTFMFWLQEHRGKLSQDSLAAATTGVSSLTEDERLEIWENLLYQTQIESAPALVEGLIKLLQADHFLGHYNQAVAALADGEELALNPLNKAAKASVIIPNELFSTPDPATPSSVPSVDAKSKRILGDQLEIAIASQHSAFLTTALEELQAAEKQYKKDYHTEREAAYQAYLEQIRQQEANSTPDEPAPEPADFSFTPSTPLDSAYLQDKISSNSLIIYQYALSGLHQTLADTLAVIEETLARKQKTKHQKLQQNAPRTLIHEGIQIPLRNRPLNNAFIFKAVPLEEVENLYSIYVTQYFESPESKVRKIEAFVETSEDFNSNEITTEVVHETEHYVTLQLFRGGIPLNSPEATFRVHGNFETEDSQYNSTFDYEQVKSNSLTTARTPNGNQTLQTIPLPDIYGIMGVKIAEFKKVNQTLCCYTEGEVSHIENILAREYKERQTRNLTRSELTTEETSERETEDKTDTSSTERHEIQSEISLMLQEDESKNTALSAGVNGSYKFGSNATLGFNASGSLNTSSSSSSSSNFSESETYAKELTQKAMKRIVEKTTYKRTAKMLREYEETNKHGFDNREGDKHVTGVYRWVDKIYQNDLVNYGKRLMYEFTLPEPAKNYKHLLITKLEEEQGESCHKMLLEKPLSPEHFGIEHYWDISKWNLDELAGYYGIDLDEYPVRFKTIAKSFSENFGLTGSQADENNDWVGAKNFQFKIPEGYTCKGFDSKYSAREHDVNNGLAVNLFGHVLIGDQRQEFTTESVRWFGGTINTPHEEYLPIAVVTRNVGAFGITVWADLEIKQEYHDRIRTEYFAAIWQAYREKMQAYQDALYAQCLEKQQQANAQQEVDYNMPSQMARAVERTEIKRLIIELIMEKISIQNYGTPISIGQNNYLLDNCSNTYCINSNNGYYQQHMKYAKFLEQAFEWEIMAYQFLPYYWADEKDWGDLLTINTSTDLTFLAFLRAGMSNVVLPVRPGLEKSVAFLLETGKLWRGTGFILAGQDDLYPAIEQNLQIEVDEEGNEVAYNDQKQLVPVIEATWETRVPSTLTIVQDYSNPLEEEGLPCFCDPDRNNHIGYSPTGNYNLLEGKTEQP